MPPNAWWENLFDELEYRQDDFNCVAAVINDIFKKHGNKKIDLKDFTFKKYHDLRCLVCLRLSKNGFFKRLTNWARKGRGWKKETLKDAQRRLIMYLLKKYLIGNNISSLTIEGELEALKKRNLELDLLLEQKKKDDNKKKLQEIERLKKEIEEKENMLK